MLAASLAASLASAPSGTYEGSKSILGIKIDATVTTDSATTMDLLLTGAASVTCKGEKYAYDGKAAISLPGISTAGDCVHDALASQDASIKSITYDASADSITVAAKKSFLSVSLVLTKQGSPALAERPDLVRAERALWFSEFKAEFGRRYASAAEETLRFSIFEDNLQLIAERNADGDLGSHFVNQFADVSPEEFRATHLGYKPRANATEQLEIAELELPLTPSGGGKSIDWRKHTPKVLTAVKDQGQCGSCWAFSATEQIETDVALATGKLYTLSPQQITSCDKTDLGCNGGNTETAYDYVKKAGLEADSEYPYKSGTSGKTGKCEYDASSTVVKIASYGTVSKSKRSEGKMLTQMEKSPISVCVDATKWQTYTSGVLGKSCGHQLDHCVQAVGYNAAKKYWVVRNSWGTSWGNDGYIYVKEGLNACGIAMDATVVRGASVGTAAGAVEGA